MIVKEMIRQLRVSLNDMTEPYQISTDQLYLLLQSAYMTIQRKSTQWRFHHRRELFFTTEVGVADYVRDGAYYVNPASLYMIEDGLTQRQPLYIKKYNDWVIEQTVTVQDSQVPLYLVHTPPFEWKVDPVPNKVWHIYADYWINPIEFVDEDSEPMWADEFHEIVLLEAMQPASAFRPESKEALAMNARVASALPALRRAFANKYLNTTVGARPLM